MDATARRVSEYAVRLDYSHLSPDTVHEAKRRIIDALGCAMGGYTSEPARIARRLASRTRSSPPTTVLGSGPAVSPDLAAFANTVMLRYLDCNDTFVSIGTGHPSDMIPAVLAAGEITRGSGKVLITGTVLAYEVCGRFSEKVSIDERGWDQGVFSVIGAACGAGRALGLSKEQMAHAVSIAVVPNLPLRQTRAGELSMWKGCATAAATRNGVFAALLAGEGLEGPFEPFEGRHGLYEQATGPIDLGELGGDGVPFRLDHTSLKLYPSQIHTQAPAALALELRDRVGLEDVAAINLETYRSAWRSAGLEPEKWDPKTRETADHSLPYVISVAFRDGRVDTDSFTRDRVLDPALRPLMGKVHVGENAAFTARYPAEQPCRMEVVTRSGERFYAETSHPKGHPVNPLTDAELEDKFHGLASGVLAKEQRDRALDALWSLERVEEIGPLLSMFRCDGEGARQ